MIVSASRRTDIPALYGEWFMRRVRAGFCRVPNPFNAKQISQVSLAPSDVDAVVFWTKDFAPLLPHVDELEDRGLPFYVLYTITGYDALLEPGVPPLDQRLETFARLAARVGAHRVIWRYDPIIASNRTDEAFHQERFSRIAAALQGLTDTVVMSLLEVYRKTERRLGALSLQGFRLEPEPLARPAFRPLLSHLAQVAARHGMHLQSCAQRVDLAPLGIPTGRCIDAARVARLGGAAPSRKDRGQRAACLCHESRDIGVGDTCLHGCRYCYATRSHALAQRRHKEHDPDSPLLWGPPPPGT